MSAARKVRITKAPFDYRWQSGAISAFKFESIGTEPMLKGEVADYIVANGYGEELKKKAAPRKRAASKKAGKTTVSKPRAVAKAKQPSEAAADASAANIREDAPLDAAHAHEDGAQPDGGAVDSGAS